MTNFSGTWNAVISKSTFITLPPAAMQATIEHRDPELREEIVATKADGSHERGSFFYRTTGESHENFLNGRPIRSVARWVGDELFFETWMELDSRETYFCDCWSLSSHKQTLVMEHRNDVLAGQRVVLVRAA